MLSWDGARYQIDYEQPPDQPTRTVQTPAIEPVGMMRQGHTLLISRWLVLAAAAGQTIVLNCKYLCPITDSRLPPNAAYHNRCLSESGSAIVVLSTIQVCIEEEEKANNRHSYPYVSDVMADD